MKLIRFGLYLLPLLPTVWALGDVSLPALKKTNQAASFTRLKVDPAMAKALKARADRLQAYPEDLTGHDRTFFAVWEGGWGFFDGIDVTYLNASGGLKIDGVCYDGIGIEKGQAIVLYYSVTNYRDREAGEFRNAFDILTTHPAYQFIFAVSDVTEDYYTADTGSGFVVDEMAGKLPN